MPRRAETPKRPSGRIHVGLSGWDYPQWREGFYRGVPRRRWLAHCAARFDALEIDGTFYRRLSPTAGARLRAEADRGLVLTAKGHRVVTHFRRLKQAEPSIQIHRESMAVLEPHLRACFWQLPERFRADAGRLDDFLRALEAWPEVRHAVELRHPSWFTVQTAELLARRAVANVISDSAAFARWDEVTTDLVYVRLHGHTRAYASRYSGASLARWASRALAWQAEGRDVYVFFDNDAEGHAPYDALRLRERLGLSSVAR